MKAPLISTLLVVTAMTLATPARAQCLEKFVNDCIRDCKRNNCWPEPFVRTDRAAIRVPFDMMVQRGWQEQNLLSGAYFKEDGKDLNEAGQSKLRWIVTEAPRHHRTIFVQTADTPEHTAARMALVQEAASRFMAGSEQSPQVVPVSMGPASWSAEQVDAVSRKFQSSMPDPRMPKPKDEQQ